MIKYILLLSLLFPAISYAECAANTANWRTTQDRIAFNQAIGVIIFDVEKLEFDHEVISHSIAPIYLRAAKEAVIRFRCNLELFEVATANYMLDYSEVVYMSSPTALQKDIFPQVIRGIKSQLRRSILYLL